MVLVVHLVLSVLAALGICVMFCGSWSASGAVSACCTWHMFSVCVYCGAWSVPGAVSACCTWHMCWLYACVVVTWCCQCLLHLAYVLAICGAWSASMFWYCGVLGVHLVQEGSGPCKIPNFSHILRSYGTYMHFVRHVHIDPRQSQLSYNTPNLL